MPTPARQLDVGLGEHAGVADEAGADDRDADVARAQVRAQTEGEAAQAELGGAVERGLRGGGLAGERGDEQQVPAAARGHRRREHARHDDRGAQVDVERAVDLLEAEALERPRAREGRVGDEDVDVAGLAEQAIDLGGIAEIDGERASVELGGQGLEHVGAPAREDQLGAVPVQLAGDRVADAAGGAGEQDGGAGDLHEVRAYDNADHRAVRPDGRG